MCIHADMYIYIYKYVYRCFSLYIQLYISASNELQKNIVLQATCALCCKQRATSDKRRDTSDEWRMSAEAAVSSL